MSAPDAIREQLAARMRAQLTKMHSSDPERFAAYVRATRKRHAFEREIFGQNTGPAHSTFEAIVAELVPSKAGGT